MTKKPIKAISAADIRKLLQSDDVLDRLEGVGRTIYGPEWITPLAKTLGVARQTLHNWLTEATWPPENLDAMLQGLIREAAKAAALKARSEAVLLADADAELEKRIRKEG